MADPETGTDVVEDPGTDVERVPSAQVETTVGDTERNVFARLGEDPDLNDPNIVRGWE